MSIFGKIAFWKHDTTPSPSTPPDMGIGQDRTGLRSETNFPDEIGQDTTGLPNMERPNPSFNQPTQLPKLEPIEETPPSQPSAFGRLNEIRGPQQTSSKDLEIINSKVDTIKAMLDNLTHKIEKIEKIAEGEEEKPQKIYGGW